MSEVVTTPVWTPLTGSYSGNDCHDAVPADAYPKNLPELPDAGMCLYPSAVECDIVPDEVIVPPDIAPEVAIEVTVPVYRSDDAISMAPESTEIDILSPQLKWRLCNSFHFLLIKYHSAVYHLIQFRHYQRLNQFGPI